MKKLYDHIKGKDAKIDMEKVIGAITELFDDILQSGDAEDPDMQALVARLRSRLIIELKK